MSNLKRVNDKIDGKYIPTYANSGNVRDQTETF
jgi:hypothetical protein